MPQTCSICKHPRRHEIEKLLLNGTSLREIVGQFPDTSKSSLNRHKPHITKTLIEAKHAETVSNAEDLLAQVKAYLKKTDGIFQAVHDDGDYRVALLALREAREYLKLLLEAQGSLQPEGTQRTVVFVYPAPAQQQSCNTSGGVDG